MIFFLLLSTSGIVLIARRHYVTDGVQLSPSLKVLLKGASSLALKADSY
jgi:hypothetical protein